MLRRALATTALASLVLWSPPSTAAVPQLLTEQGRLVDENDKPLSTPQVIVFAIYPSAAGTPDTALWTETQTITPDDGYFSAEIGAFNPLPPTLFSGQALYLGLTVGSDAEMTPRQPIVATPYAFTAGNAIGDITPASVAIQAAPGPMPVIDSTGTWVGQPIAAAKIHNGIIGWTTVTQTRTLSVPVGAMGGVAAAIPGLEQSIATQAGDILLFTLSGQFFETKAVGAGAVAYVAVTTGQKNQPIPIQIRSTEMYAIYAAADLPQFPAQSTSGSLTVTADAAGKMTIQGVAFSNGGAGISFGTNNPIGSLTVIQIRP
jgi:hypothetical protein